MSAVDPPGAGHGARDHVRVVLRPMGTPLPLGLLALGIASFLVSAVELHVVALSNQPLVAVALFALVAPAQLLTSVMGFWARDPVAGTGMALLGGTWLVTGLLQHGGMPGVRQPALGLVLCAAAAAILVPTVASGRTKLAVTATMSLALARFAVLGAYDLGAPHAVQQASGVIGFVLAGVAWYAALATEVESAAGHPVLPVFRPGAGRRAQTGDLADETAGVLHEAGVRRTL